MRPPRIATACAHERAGSSVYTAPPVSARSAGWASPPRAGGAAASSAASTNAAHHVPIRERILLCCTMLGLRRPLLRVEEGHRRDRGLERRSRARYEKPGTRLRELDRHPGVADVLAQARREDGVRDAPDAAAPALDRPALRQLGS